MGAQRYIVGAGGRVQTDIDDLRESPALDVIHLLMHKGTRAVSRSRIRTIAEEWSLNSVAALRTLSGGGCVVIIAIKSYGPLLIKIN